MKKKFFVGIAALVFTVTFGLNMKMNAQETTEDRVDDNVEALDCGALKNYTCWKSISGGICPTRQCSACNLIWFTTGSNSSSCAK